MVDKMRRKISAIFVTLVMCISGIVIIPDTIEVKADSGTREESSLDMNLIYSVSENLSNVIFDAYEDDELHKGRAFGSKEVNMML